jgi:hypothetical protein
MKTSTSEPARTHWISWRGPHCGPDAFGEVPAGNEVVPSPGDSALRLRRGRPSPKAAPRQSRPPQAVTSVRRALRRSESAQGWHLQTSERGQRGTHQHLEHPTATSLIPLKRISKFLCFLHTQRPSWLYKCKFHCSIMSMGDSAFPRKPSPPWGLLRGSSPL